MPPCVSLWMFVQSHSIKTAHQSYLNLRVSLHLLSSWDTTQPNGHERQRFLRLFRRWETRWTEHICLGPPSRDSLQRVGEEARLLLMWISIEPKTIVIYWNDCIRLKAKAPLERYPRLARISNEQTWRFGPYVLGLVSASRWQKDRVCLAYLFRSRSV